MLRFRWECPASSLGSFTLNDMRLWITGHFRSLSWSMTPPKMPQLPLLLAQLSQLWLIRRGEYLQMMGECPSTFTKGSFQAWAIIKKGIDRIKCTSPPANSQDLHLTSLLPYFFQHPAVASSDECVPSAPGWSSEPSFESLTSPVSHTLD